MSFVTNARRLRAVVARTQRHNSALSSQVFFVTALELSPAEMSCQAGTKNERWPNGSRRDSLFSKNSDDALKQRIILAANMIEIQSCSHLLRTMPKELPYLCCRRTPAPHRRLSALDGDSASPRHASFTTLLPSHRLKLRSCAGICALTRRECNSGERKTCRRALLRSLERMACVSARGGPVVQSTRTQNHQGGPAHTSHGRQQDNTPSRAQPQGTLSLNLGNSSLSDALECALLLMLFREIDQHGSRSCHATVDAAMNTRICTIVPESKGLRNLNIYSIREFLLDTSQSLDTASLEVDSGEGTTGWNHEETSLCPRASMKVQSLLSGKRRDDHTALLLLSFVELILLQLT